MQAVGPRQFFADSLFDGNTWLQGARITVDAQGSIESVLEGGDPAGTERLMGPVVPGMPNLHSHAFQRVMAGLAEYQTHPDDSFWTWRETMYRIASRITPEQQQVIARQLYLEMLQAGYTHVCEFHYLHNDPAGKRYADRSECSRRLLAASEEIGIGMTLLPVLYQHAGFDGQSVAAAQKRFELDTQEYLNLVADLDDLIEVAPERRLGVAFHSLRAVGCEPMQTVLDAVPDDYPVHIHIAEQRPEVEQCLAHHGARPVSFLFGEFPVNSRWCLVHATHLDDAEVRLIARSGAIAGLCPTTEGNLGDGLFQLSAYREQGGVFGIGSDSHASVSPIEELRWLEYGQRLKNERRNLIASAEESHCGAALWRAALTGGARASGAPIGSIAVGERADWVVLDPASTQLLGREGDLLLDSWIFSGNINSVRDVYVSGRRVIQNGHHQDEHRIAADFRAVAIALM
jgi:formimidoylglutamate deiminase